VVLANLDRVLSLWARDRRVARQTPDYLPARVFVPTPLPLYESDKQSDLQIPSLLWPAGLVPGTTLVSFHLEGGNLVANQRHLFTGINVLLENEDKFDDEAGLERMLRRLFAREPVLLRDRRNLVPWVHADMYLTPVSETLVLLADPADGWERFRSSAGVSSGSSSADTPELLGGLGPESLVLDPVLRDSFEDIQGQLTELGYQVMRLPALVNAAEEWMVSYNNVLMERRDGKRIVYMPVYDLPALDAAAADVYRRLGFEVRMIDVTGVFQLGGAIRCVANVTRRLPAPETADADCATCLGPLHIFESPYARKAEAGDGTVRKISRGGDGARGGGVR
jgi:hypothetical protein